MEGRKGLFAILVSILVAFQLAEAAQFSVKQSDQSGLDDQSASKEDEGRPSMGEHVDGIVRASGDRFLGFGQQDQDGGFDKSGQFEANNIPWQSVSGPQRLVEVHSTNGQPSLGYPIDTDSYLRASDVDMGNYRALVDEFKHWSPLANPSRQSRAFKPRLMSTARGFGKRANWQQVGNRRPPSYVDLAVIASAADRKVAGNRLSNSYL